MDKLKAEIIAGALIGVRVLAALIIVLLSAGWVFGDYFQLRSGVAEVRTGVAELQKVMKNVCAVSVDQSGTSVCAEHRSPQAAEKPSTPTKEAPRKP